MPLTGTICCMTGEPGTFASCIECAKEHRCSYPLPLLMEMSEHDAGRRGVAISASQIGGCARQYHLKRDYPYNEYPDDYNARFDGTLFHHGMVIDHHPWVQEHRLWGKIGDIPISGTPDVYDKEHRVVIDWKKTKKAPHQPHGTHYAQIQCYVELLSQYDLPVDRAYIMYYDGSWKRRNVNILPNPERTEYLTTLIAPFAQSALPERLLDYPNNKLCQHCPVADLCEQNT